jgi:hypothetical protein
MVAGNLYGSQYLTEDLDIVYETSQGNRERLCSALEPLGARVVGHWPVEGSDRVLTPEILAAERSVTVGTTEGEIDVLERIDGVGAYDDVEGTSETIEVEGRAVRVISLAGLIATKRASGREKDRVHLAELELIAEVSRLRDGD